jgi:hypothetical protein
MWFVWIIPPRVPVNWWRIVLRAVKLNCAMKIFLPVMKICNG